MSYNDFMEEILGIIGENGIEDRVRFYKDDKGKYKAHVGEITFTGNSKTTSLTVRWASHMAMIKAGA